MCCISKRERGAQDALLLSMGFTFDGSKSSQDILLGQDSHLI